MCKFTCNGTFGEAVRYVSQYRNRLTLMLDIKLYYIMFTAGKFFVSNVIISSTINMHCHFIAHFYILSAEYNGYVYSFVLSS